MGGAFPLRRVVRHVVLLIVVGALAAVAVPPAVASTEAGRPAVYRLSLSATGPAVAIEATFTAVLEKSRDGGTTWAPAAGEIVTVAYVTDGAGAVSAVNGGPVGDMTCVSDVAGRCTITVRTDQPGDSVVLASARGLTAGTPAA